MGNSSSKKGLEKDLNNDRIIENINEERMDNFEQIERKSFEQIIDFIATKYILTSNFQSLRKLYEKEYCEDLVILTSNIIEKNLNDLEIQNINNRIKNGVTNDKQNAVYLKKSDIDNLDIESPEKKKMMCNNIAKFYIKIAHIFAAIVTTINPVYTYKDNFGNIIKKKLYQKDEIPENADVSVNSEGICERRVDSLKSHMIFNENGQVSIQPNFCGMNVNTDGTTKTLDDEPGIPELMELYEDKYNYQTGQFSGMTSETEKIYKRDLDMFYKVFTGSVNVPMDIKKFSDIKLREYHKSPGCMNMYFGEKSRPTNNEDEIDSDELITLYADNLRNMMYTISDSQDELLKIINKIFSYVSVEDSGEKKVIINPELNETNLQQVLGLTRELIVNLYLRCENEYVHGIKIYQALVEKQIKDTTIRQIDVLEKTKQEMLEDQIQVMEEKQNIPEPKPTFEEKIDENLKQEVKDI